LSNVETTEKRGYVALSTTPEGTSSGSDHSDPVHCRHLKTASLVPLGYMKPIDGRPWYGVKEAYILDSAEAGAISIGSDHLEPSTVHSGRELSE